MSFPIFDDTNWDARVEGIGSSLVWTTGGWYYDGEYGGCDDCMRGLELAISYDPVSDADFAVEVYFPGEGDENIYEFADFRVYISTSTGSWYFSGVCVAGFHTAGYHLVTLPLPHEPVEETTALPSNPAFVSGTVYIIGSPWTGSLESTAFLFGRLSGTGQDRPFYLGVGIPLGQGYWTAFNKTEEFAE